MAQATTVGECDGAKEGKRLCKNASEYQLVKYHSLPDYLKDNEYILDYYRSEWPLKQLFHSIFSFHNETLNVWTHLIGFFLFLALTTVFVATTLPKLVDINSLQQWQHVALDELKASSLPHHLSNLQLLMGELKTSVLSMNKLTSLSINWHLPELISTRSSHANQTSRSMREDLVDMEAPVLERPVPHWPVYVYLGGAMFCLLASSACHLLACHSRRAAYVMLRLDYAGIATFISTSICLSVSYIFACDPFVRNFYLASVSVLCAGTICATLLPVLQSTEYRYVRVGLFFGLFISSAVPEVHKLVLFGHHPEAIYTTGLYILGGAMYGLGTALYVMRIPERWMPGKFDIVGHSHQLFHALVVAGAIVHYRAGMIYLNWRDVQGC